MKSLISYIKESFTIDDEMIARYKFIFKSKWPMDEIMADEMDIDMWNSIGFYGKQQVVQDVKFTGFLNVDTTDPDYNAEDSLLILTPCVKKDIFDYLDDEIGNVIDSINGKSNFTPTDDGYYHVTIAYDDEIIRFHEYDWQDSPHIKLKGKWHKQIDRNPNWIINESLGVYWVKSDSCIKDICKYTDWHFYKNGKLIH